MAQQAGWDVPAQWDETDGFLRLLERFAALIAAAEREECARVCDFEVVRLTAIVEPRPALAAGICAAAIRARSFAKPAQEGEK